MCGVEIVGGLRAGSVSLLADAVDFAGDAANCALSLSVLSMGLLWRARAALIKGVTMAVYGMLVLAISSTALLHTALTPQEPGKIHSRKRFWRNYLDAGCPLCTFPSILPHPLRKACLVQRA